MMIFSTKNTICKNPSKYIILYMYVLQYIFCNNITYAKFLKTQQEKSFWRLQSTFIDPFLKFEDQSYHYHLEILQLFLLLMKDIDVQV